MIPGSLRLRLLAGAVLWIGLALVIAWVAIGAIFTTTVEAEVGVELEGSLNRLIASIAPDAEAPTLSGQLPDPRYAIPFSGYYWQIIDTASTRALRSRSLWDVVLPATAEQDGHLITVVGPSGQNLSALVRQVNFVTTAGNRQYLVTVAEDRAILDRSIDRFTDDLTLALAVLGGVLLVAAYLQVQLGLSPLNRLRAGIEGVRHGRSETLSDTGLTELRPLVSEVNELLGAQRQSLEFARSRAADLAHGLKTPLSVLRVAADRLRAKGDTESSALIEGLAGEMSERVDYQLRLSRLRLRPRSHVYRTSLSAALSRSIAVLRLTHEGSHLKWDADLEHEVLVNLDQHDLMELIGVLLENAAKWARSTVAVRVQLLEGEVQVSITDDGPGLSDSEISQLGGRGTRLDQSRQGSGLGLAIAFEIVDYNSGTLRLGRADLGGLLVCLNLPLAPDE